MVKLVWKTSIIYLRTDSKLSKEIYVLLAIWVTTKKQNRSFIEKLPHKLNLRVFLAVAKVFKVFLATGLKIQEKQGADNLKKLCLYKYGKKKFTSAQQQQKVHCGDRHYLSKRIVQSYLLDVKRFNYTFFQTLKLRWPRKRIFPTATFCTVSHAWMIEQKNGAKPGPHCSDPLSIVPNNEERRERHLGNQTRLARTIL